MSTIANIAHEVKDRLHVHKLNEHTGSCVSCGLRPEEESNAAEDQSASGADGAGAAEPVEGSRKSAPGKRSRKSTPSTNIPPIVA